MAEPEKLPPSPPLRSKRRLTRWLIVIGLLAVIAFGGWRLWQYTNGYEATDDAQIDGHINSISSRLTGTVVDIRTEDEQFVKQGDVLVLLDPKDYDVAVAKAEADLADAEAALETSRTNVPIVDADTASQLKTAKSTRTDADAAVAGAERQLRAAQARLLSAQAQVREAEANLKKANDDVARYKLLTPKNEIPQQQYDTAVSVADAAQAALDARKAAVSEAEQNIVVAQSSVDQTNQRIAQADASIDAANTAPQQVKVSQSKVQEAVAQVAQKRALLDQAKLNLSYCTITAPVTGIVGKKTVELGQNVTPGQLMMAVVPLEDIWVTANFKETQLGRMKAGQRVRVSVDALDHSYTGRIVAVGGASGARFSVIPPENATGNYVKVVQRIPVRINLDPGQNNDHLLRPGMSVDPKVYLE